VTRPGNSLLLGFGLTAVLAAVFSPLASWGEHRSFAAHMGQHLLLGDIGPLLLVLALGAVATSPLLAVPLWMVNLALWHVPVVYEAALHHEALHVLQHVTLFAAGALAWSSLLSPRRDPAVRILALATMMVFGLILAGVFLWWPNVVYTTYAHARTLGGIAPHSDQRVGGGLMLLEGSLLNILVGAWLVLSLLREEAVTPSAEGVSPSP
jgi:putative membrane protein